MGMAASQARHLALVARQANCEYEGQQINQARLTLANQSANLFSQMLGLQVPVPPSMQDYTKVQYSFSDGNSKTTMDSWNQLATPEEDFNYIVTYHYNSEVYTGSQKRMTDPQVQFSLTIPSDPSQYENQIIAIQRKLKEIEDYQEKYDKAVSDYRTVQSQASNLASYADNVTRTNILEALHSEDFSSYTVKQQKLNTNGNGFLYEYNDSDYKLFTDGEGIYYQKDGIYYTKNASNEYSPIKSTIDPSTFHPVSEIYKKADGLYYCAYDDGGTVKEIEYKDNKKDLNAITDDYIYTAYSELDETLKAQVGNAIEELKSAGALPEEFNASDAYYDTDKGILAFKSDLDALVSTGGNGTKTMLPSYYITSDKIPDGLDIYSIDDMQNEVLRQKGVLDVAKANLDKAQAEYDMMSVPSYIGNCALTPLAELSEQDIAEIQQIIKDMQAQGVDTNIAKCFNTLDGTYDNTTYKGGLYTFKQGGTVYFVSYYDLAEAANSGEGINHIDNQSKLPYYNASYVTTKIEKTEKALLQTDGSGRFNSIRLADDTIIYTLETETIQDDAAYNDAMNQYYYQSAQYDKMIQDLNAKTSIIQQEDKQLELRLTQLDTERNALSKEIEAVSKVVKDNVEKSFKTFNG